MATYSLVHGAWHGGWAWDLVRTELEQRGHVVHTPDLPIEDVDAGVEDYAAAVPPAGVVVGHSMAGLVIPHVEAAVHIYVCALVGRRPADEGFARGFGDARVRDALGRSYYPDPAAGARELQYPPEYARLAVKLRRQATIDGDGSIPAGRWTYVVCARDACVSPDYQRRVANNPVELDAGHSPMLECPRELADILEA